MIYNYNEILVNSYIIPKTLKIDVFGKNIIYAYLLVKLLLLCKKKICLLLNELVNSTTYHALLGRFSLLVSRKMVDKQVMNYIGEYDLPVLSLFREVIGRCVRNEGRGKEEEWRGSRTPKTERMGGGVEAIPPISFLKQSLFKTIPLLSLYLSKYFPYSSRYIPITTNYFRYNTIFYSK